MLVGVETWEGKGRGAWASRPWVHPQGWRVVVLVRESWD